MCGHCIALAVVLGLPVISWLGLSARCWFSCSNENCKHEG